MRTKLFFIALATITLGISQVSAQDVKARPNKEQVKVNKEQMKQNKVDRMVNALMLDDATTAKFKPAYEKYLNELGEARAMNKPVQKPAKDAVCTPLTDAQIQQIIEKDFAQKRKMLDVREKYYKEFKKYLTPKQLLKVFNMEKGKHHKFNNDFRKDARKDFRKAGMEGKQQTRIVKIQVDKKGDVTKETKE